MNVHGKNIVITGGSLGIGKETAFQLLKKGANVLVTGRSMDRLQSAFVNSNAQLISFDISDIDNLSQNAKKCVDVFNGKIDVLINNAGIGVRKSIDELTFNDFLNVYNVNVFGLSLFTKNLVKVMKNQKHGTIINIGSTASLKGYKNGSIYASSKFALRCLSQCWQSELRPYNIRVCQINPSEVTTAFGSLDRVEREDVHNKLSPREIAHSIISAIEMDERGFVNELNIWATNPF
ncbi:MAG: short-chain dehydrogenase [Flavobacteriales bacterium]|nr:short-chain dehydrogenase [Flavobacteriales bacterium]